MKRFRFPLQPVGVLRAHRELHAKERFAAAVQVFVQAEADLAATLARQHALELTLFASRKTTYRAAEAAQLLADYRRECTAEAAAERRGAAARVEIQKCREAYLEAHRNLEIVNRLEVKARATHRRATDREEQAEFDDRAGSRHLKPEFSSP